MKKIIFLLLGWLLIVNIFALLGLNRLNLKSDTAYKWIDPQKFVQEQSWNSISFHSRWDSVYYLDIAQNGYHFTKENTLSNIVFFPFYSALIFVVSLLIGPNFILAGWIVSVLALIGSVIVFYKLIKEFHPTIDPENAIFYLLIFPTAFFLNAVYTESIFLFLSLLTFYYLHKGRFGLAGFFGLLSALTRITGVLLFIPIVWEFYKRNGWRKIFSFSFLPTLLVPLGTMIFFLYHYFVFGNFFLFFDVENAWGRTFQLNKEHFLLFSNPAIVNLSIDLLFTTFALICAVHMFKKRWVSYGLYTVTTLGVALSTGTFMSIGRYILVLFPIYLVLASVKNQNFAKIYTIGSVFLLAMNIILFVNWYWAG